jgi:mannose-6-phosphate isomerase
MELTQPIVFEPLFMERLWGGRRLESLFGKRLPPTARIGESWEIVDREDAQSVVHEGPLQGLTLNELWTQHRDTVFGPGLPEAPRFPLLFKLLDAQERLSVQVHPRPENAASLGGEPKTEMWYVLDALLESDLYAGLKRGVTRAAFELALREGRVAEMIHHLPIKAGDAIFIPSGRIHAIGTGNVIFEVQQNSDTTYRVFDWNRLGLDGQPRALHIEESLQSIDFEDFEPALIPAGQEQLVACAFFDVEKWTLPAPRPSNGGGFAIFCVAGGRVECGGREFHRGEFFLVPAALSGAEIKPLEADSSVLRTTIAA